MKTFFKKYLSVTGFLFYTSFSFASGIPVVDVAQIAENAAAQAEHMIAWADQKSDMVLQIANQVEQINQLKEEFDSMNGSRMMGFILNNPDFRDHLPDDWQDVYDKVKDSGYSGLSGTAKSIYNGNKIYDRCAFMRIEEDRLICEAQSIKASLDKGFALDAFDSASNRIDQIDQLMVEINYTTDPKSIAELQARIAAEQANIQNEQTKLQLYKMVADAESRVQLQRKRELQARIWALPGGTEIVPITFD